MRKLIYCAIPALLAASQPAWADGPRWQVSEASGDVQVMRAGVSRTATRGGMLYAGDILVTGNRGRAVVTRGEEYMIVSPSSRLRMPGDTRSGGITQIIEEIGNVIYNVQRRNHQHFSVETPYLAAVVKGTTFSVTVDENGSSVQVLEGLVEVSTLDGGASDLVEPGEVALVATGDRYRLTVEGDETTVIESPNAPEGGTQNTVTAAITVPVSGSSVDEIQSEIRAAPVSVGMLTNGLVDGETEARLQYAEANGRRQENEIIYALASGEAGAGNQDGSEAENGSNDDRETDAGNAGDGNGSGAGADDGGEGNGSPGIGGENGSDESSGDNGVGNGYGNGDGNDDGGCFGNDDDDGNNGHGNDDDGVDDSNPGGGNGRGNGGSHGNGGGNGNGDGNNGHGNDDDGVDESNPGNGGGNGNGRNRR